MHSCIPNQCRCRDKKGLQPAFHADIYLEPMIKVVEEMTGKRIELVSCKSVE